MSDRLDEIQRYTVIFRGEDENGACILYSDAKALLAAKDAEIEGLKTDRDYWKWEHHLKELHLKQEKTANLALKEKVNGLEHFKVNAEPLIDSLKEKVRELEVTIEEYINVERYHEKQIAALTRQLESLRAMIRGCKFIHKGQAHEENGCTFDHMPWGSKCNIPEHYTCETKHQLESAEAALEPIREVWEKYKDFPSGCDFDWDVWNAIKKAVGKETE